MNASRFEMLASGVAALEAMPINALDKTLGGNSMCKNRGVIKPSISMDSDSTTIRSNCHPRAARRASIPVALCHDHRQHGLNDRGSMTTPYTPIIPTTDAAELPVDAIHGGFTDREAIYVSPDGTQIYLVPLSSITMDCALINDKSAYQLGFQAALQFAREARV